MSCNTDGCIRIAKYLAIKNGQNVRYCLICINKIKEQAYA